MLHDTSLVNSAPPAGGVSTAALRNVALCNGALQRTIDRAAHLPGMVVFHGPSGFGKSTAAAFVGNRHRATYVQVKSVWTKKDFLQAVLHQMGMRGEKGSNAALVDKICEELVLSRRPLIIDEMDLAVDRKLIPLVFDLYEGSEASILLIGEERLPGKLAKFEKFDGRIMDWVPAVPVNVDDARQLRSLYVRKIQIADDLLAHLVKLAGGSARRIVTNLDRIETAAVAAGMEAIDLKGWGDRPLYTGKAPAPRA